MGYDAVVQLVVPEVLKAHVPSNHWELLTQIAQHHIPEDQNPHNALNIDI